MDYGHELVFGTFVTPGAADPQRAVSLARLTEEAGLDLVTFQDHPYQPAFLDTWTLLSWVAAETTTVRLAANVLNLPLRPPAVLARAAASLDLLSGGRVALGIGAGAFWDGIEAMGGTRLTPGESVDALGEAIEVIRAIWDVEERGGARVDGRHHRVSGARRGPAPAHDIPVWVGAYKPRMLRLVGAKADGWLPSLSYLEEGALGPSNRAIDDAARAAGRDPRAIRRLLNLSPGAFSDRRQGFLQGPPEAWVEDLLPFAVEHGVGTFIITGDDPEAIGTFGQAVAPALREAVAAARLTSPAAEPRPEPEPVRTADPPRPRTDDPGDLGLTPTPDDGARLSAREPWDESTRPRRVPAAGVSYTRRGRLVGQHLIDVHDGLRRELGELRQILSEVRDGARTAGEARAALNDMALRQNDWALGAFCARYCAIVGQHHGIEDTSIFPHLSRSEPELAPVIDRLVDEHHVIHDAIQDVDRALVRHIREPDGFGPIQEALDFLTDALLSHLSYEEQEMVEPLARLGFYSGQIREGGGG